MRTTDATFNSNSIFQVRLFWKILLWFWFAIALIMSSHMFVSHVLSDKTRFRNIPPPAEQELARVAHELIPMLSRHKINSHRKPKRLKDIFLIDDKQKDFLNRHLPYMLLSLDAQVAEQNKPLAVFKRRESFFGGTQVSLENQKYRLYIRRTESSLSRHFIGGFFRDFTRGLFISIFIISFPISFLLSWLITQPIKRFQDSTKEIKKNLNNRVSLNQLMNRKDEFGDLAQDFNEMADHLHETLESQKQLISDVSHELRSPLARLQIALGIAEKELNGNQQLERLKKEANRMDTMLENILTLSRLQSSYTAFEKTELDINELLQLVIKDCEFEATQKNISITHEIESNHAITINRELMLSAIENILRNAIKYCHNGSQISCRISTDTEQLYLTISDNGPGIPESKIHRIFDAFYRPDEARNQKEGGVGLGLSIAKRAVEANAGKLSASNVKPHGLRMTIKLPL